jgi:glycosyltransferase involved in cell wall biosynthesis
MEATLTSKLVIVIPTLNRPILLERSVSCVLKQSFKDWCLIIVNDGGNQAEVEELIDFLRNKYNCPNEIVIIHNQISIGKSASCNKALSLAKTEMAIILNDDDTWAYEFLTMAVSQLEYISHSVNPNVKGIISLANLMYEEIIDDYTIIKFCDIPGEKQLNPYKNYIHIQSLATENIFSSSQFVFYKKAADYIGPFNPELVIFSDWEFHIRFACAFSIYIINQPFVNLHMRPEAIDRSYLNLLQINEDQHEYYNELVTASFLKARPLPLDNDAYSLSLIQIQTILNLRLANKGGAQIHSRYSGKGLNSEQIRQITDLTQKVNFLEHQSRIAEDWFRHIDYRLTPSYVRKGKKLLKLLAVGLGIKNKRQKFKKLLVSLSKNGFKKTLSKIKSKLNEKQTNQ